MARKEEVCLCECGSVEHQIIFEYDTEYNEVYVSIHLYDYKGFWKRLVSGMKYIFGYKSKYGQFDSFEFQLKDADKLQSVVNALKNISYEEYVQKKLGR